MTMFPTAAQSASFKQMLKKQPATDQLRRMATRHPAEADEAFSECADGFDTCVPLSWVWEQAVGTPPAATRLES